MSDRTLIIDGVRVPRFLYGTAWKEEATQQLVEQAIAAGFRGIDTANQRRHYHEAAVGQGIAACIERGVIVRDNLFLQTKFTFQPGQDHRLPYDPNASTATQVAQSFASSLEHLGVTSVDAYLLHGPMTRSGLMAADLEAWEAMEEIQESGRARLIGVSNFTLEQLEELSGKASVPPRFVQNRCFAATGWDRDVRAFCAENKIVYQGFSLLTANRQVLAHPVIIQIAKRHDSSVPQIVFRFALDVGMIPLTGTTDAGNMSTDLEAFDFSLDANEVAQIETLALR